MPPPARDTYALALLLIGFILAAFALGVIAGHVLSRRPVLLRPPATTTTSAVDTVARPIYYDLMEDDIETRCEARDNIDEWPHFRPCDRTATRDAIVKTREFPYEPTLLCDHHAAGIIVEDRPLP